MSLSLDQLKEQHKAPNWMTEEGLKTLQKGYLLDGEQPFDMYQRVAKASASRLNRPDLAIKFFEIMWKGWLCLATPVAANMGAERGLPISCYSSRFGDSVDSIFQKQHELAMLSKNGGGVGVYFGHIRGRGSDIAGNGHSEGIIPWAKCVDTTTIAVSQGQTRRGATVVYLPAEHTDIDEFLQIRRPTGDANRRCLNIHHAVTITDSFMQRAVDGSQRERDLWAEMLKTRFETGEPYFLFVDAVNRANPPTYVERGLKVETSNLCNEIMLYTDEEHTFVCCLSSMNLTKWDEWKDTDAVELAIWFLDGVMEEFIAKASNKPGFESAVRFAIKSRALGLGVLGWHSLLQTKGLPFEGFQAMTLNAEVFRTIRTKAEKATADLAEAYGEPEWCKGFGRRNTHVMAVAPTTSNSSIAGGVSAGIEPIAANVYAFKSAKGTFLRKNPVLEKLLEERGINTMETWKSINAEGGSVLHLKQLTEAEKQVFLTAREISQFAIVRQAAQRQQFIDQGQSVNLFFGINSDPKYVHEVHLEAWRLGLKGLYYCRAESILRGDFAARQVAECKSCEG
jgi:ribonucleoside-diphosphate reductase alpha chain